MPDSIDVAGGCAVPGRTCGESRRISCAAERGRRVVAGPDGDSRRAGSPSRRDLAGRHGPRSIRGANEFRDPKAQRLDARSRGELVTEVLESGLTVAETLVHLREVGGHYNGFNMIFSDGHRLGIYESSRGEGRELQPGLFGLSNHLLDTPWPKVRNAKNRLAAALTRDENAILELLRDDRPAADAELPHTGVRLEWERLLSSAFVRAENYGTRCSTVFSHRPRGPRHLR